MRRDAAITLCLMLASSVMGGSDSADRLHSIARSLSPPPPPAANQTNAFADNAAAAIFGQHLFFDPGLSRHGDFSCSTCHDPAQAFADGKPVAEGTSVGIFNTPTLLGAAHHRWLFLDGRADTLWSQALSPIENDLEMASSRTDAVRHVAETKPLLDTYTTLFGPLPEVESTLRFPNGARPGTPQWNTMEPEDQQAITTAFVNLGKSIEAYERLLQPGLSDFDRWVASIETDTQNTEMMSPAAHRGYVLFAGKAGCLQCHFGPLLTDFEFHDLALPPRDPAAAPLPGRGAGYDLLRKSEFAADGVWSDAPTSTKARRAGNARIGPEHWGSFRTPSLRNTALTAPYMHAGQLKTLAEVLHFYNTLEGQIRRHHHAEAVLQPLNFTPTELIDLEAFLEALSGDPPAQYLCEPTRSDGTKPTTSAE
jgi:cytochrome c peroxidase